MDQLWEEEDGGFWSAVSSWSKVDQHTILVLTSTKIPTNVNNLPCQHVCLDKPSEVECGSKLTQMVRSNGMSWKTTQYQAILQLCQYDVRKLSHELHLYSYSNTTTTSSSKTHTKNDTNAITTKFNTTTEREEQPCASVMSVEPKIVKHDEYTKVTILGEHFHSLVKIYLNSVPCQQVQVISCQEIHVWIPPAVLPNNVDAKTGCYYRNAMECWTSHYPTLQLSFVDRPCLNGEVQLNYQFEPMECRLQFTLTTFTPESPVRQVTVEESVPQLSFDSQPELITPKCTAKKEQVEEMEQLYQQYQQTSDSIVLEDYLTHFGRPTVSGPVHGFIDNNDNKG